MLKAWSMHLTGSNRSMLQGDICNQTEIFHEGVETWVCERQMNPSRRSVQILVHE
jgi:hypothetical protein